MSRILAIDYGTRRTGIAVTDPLQIIAGPLGTFPTGDLMDFLRDYVAQEPVGTIVLGDPKYPDGNPAQLAGTIARVARELTLTFPNIPIVLHDERYTSVEAERIIRQVVPSKKKRRDKGLVDKVSAVLILQDYLEYIRQKK
jgi:putative Holliday junction resolvase